MTPEAQRVAIAEATGRWFIRSFCGKNFLVPGDHPDFFNEVLSWTAPVLGPVELLRDTFQDYKRLHPPDYLNSLDAMHEAEKVLTDEQAQKYSGSLAQLGKLSNMWFTCCHATAAQRAEAFLRTLNLWTE